jgi:hypothetical protein
MEVAMKLSAMCAVRVVVGVIVLFSAACTADNNDQARRPAPGAVSPTTGSRTPTPSADPVAAIRRPWAQPAVPAGGKCPVTTAWSRPDPELAPLLGTGPARPSIDRSAMLDYMHPNERTDWKDKTWGGQKVLWAIDPAQTGLVLIRGHRLDGAGELAFEDPVVPELVLNTGEYQGRPGGWRDNPSYTRFRAPGCYAYQVDTAQGTWSFVFVARGPTV